MVVAKLAPACSKLSEGIELHLWGGCGMDCRHCGAARTIERLECTELGYRRFRCRECGREFNERAGTPLNRLQYPSDVVCLVMVWRLRYKLSLRDLAEMFLERGFIFTHETVRLWEATLAPHRRNARRGARLVRPVPSVAALGGEP